MHTHVLLLEDVYNLGRSGDIVRVRSGFSRNFLIPQHKALAADDNARRMQAQLQAERAKKAALDRTEAEALAQQLSNVEVSIRVKVDHDGHMYGSVSTTDISRLLAEQGFTVERRSVQLPHALKQIGSHTVALKLNEGVPATIKLHILAEQSEEAAQRIAPTATPAA